MVHSHRDKTDEWDMRPRPPKEPDPIWSASMCQGCGRWKASPGPRQILRCKDCGAKMSTIHFEESEGRAASEVILANYRAAHAAPRTPPLWAD